MAAFLKPPLFLQTNYLFIGVFDIFEFMFLSMFEFIGMPEFDFMPPVGDIFEFDMADGVFIGIGDDAIFELFVM